MGLSGDAIDGARWCQMALERREFPMRTPEWSTMSQALDDRPPTGPRMAPGAPTVQVVSGRDRAAGGVPPAAKSPYPGRMTSFCNSPAFSVDASSQELPIIESLISWKRDACVRRHVAVVRQSVITVPEHLNQTALYPAPPSTRTPPQVLNHI